MPVPTHDFTCTTRAIQIKCQHCQEQVWYFSCSCGSQVFFNELGLPWERHDCQEYAVYRQLDMLVNIDKMSSEEIYKAIDKREKKGKELVDDKILDIVEREIGKRKSPLTINTIQPIIGDTEVTGKVMELNKQVNLFTRLGYDASNILSVRLLGKLGEQKWAYARVRTNADRRNTCMEFELFISHEYLKEHSLRYSDMIIGIAKSVKHPKGIIWELQKHDVY